MSRDEQREEKGKKDLAWTVFLWCMALFVSINTTILGWCVSSINVLNIKGAEYSAVIPQLTNKNDKDETRFYALEARVRQLEQKR